MHDAGQEVLPAVTAVEKGSRYDTGWSRLVAVTTLWLKVETVLHYGLPFRSMWPWPLAFFTSLPVDDQVGDFMRDGIAQKIVKIFRKQLLVDA